MIWKGDIDGHICVDCWDIHGTCCWWLYWWWICMTNKLVGAFGQLWDLVHHVFFLLSLIPRIKRIKLWLDLIWSTNPTIFFGLRVAATFFFSPASWCWIKPPILGMVGTPGIYCKTRNGLLMWLSATSWQTCEVFFKQEWIELPSVDTQINE